MNNTGKWTFEGAIASNFDEHVKSHVPSYGILHSMVTAYAAWFLESGSAAYDIGTSLGEVIRNFKAAYPTRSVRYIGIDTSSSMILEAAKRFEREPDVELYCQDVRDENMTIENACLVTAFLSLMFIPKKDRKAVVEKVYAGLNPGAAFIVVEKVRGTGAQINEIYNEIYHDMKHGAGVSEVDIFHKAQSIRGVLRPYTIKENIELLEAAGFREVGTFFQVGNFAGFIAIK